MTTDVDEISREGYNTIEVLLFVATARTARIGLDHLSTRRTKSWAWEGGGTRKLLVVRLAVVGAGNGVTIVLGVTGHEGEIATNPLRKHDVDWAVPGTVKCTETEYI